LLGVSSKSKPQATVTVKAFPNEQFKGVVDYVGAIMDEATRTVKVRVVVDNKRGLLRPGMFAELTIDLGRGEALLVPAKAVVRDEERQFVFVRLGERRFLRRDVQVGAMRSGRIEILDGLRSGEEIVVTGAFLLKSDILREKMGAGCAD
jgi:cobalt-zinc-cadmium efflux system membrane fusion protein